MALLVLTAAACTGRVGEPRHPDKSVVADRVVIADSWDVGAACQTWVFTLDSGEKLPVSTGGEEQGCVRPNSMPVPRFLGQGLAGTERGVPWPRAKRPLIFLGSDAGQSWWGGVSSDEFSDCWEIRFSNGDGAYMEPAALHLSNGLVLPLASDFVLGGVTVKDPFPLRSGDTICLNSKGEAEKATIWVGY